MSGLIQKDMCLLLQRSRVLIILIGVGAIMSFTTDGSFVIGYLAMTCAILTVGTISYDEFDNGYPFLFTLPITKKTYVTGKYVFCMLGGLIGWGISVVIVICCTLIKGGEFSVSDIWDILAFIPVIDLIVAIMLPIQLKFGAEKSRIAIFVIGGGSWAAGTLLMNNLPQDYHLPALFSNLDKNVVTVSLIVICILAIAVSYIIKSAYYGEERVLKGGSVADVNRITKPFASLYFPRFWVWSLLRFFCLYAGMRYMCISSG